MERWCGWVMVGVACLTPLLMWGGPLGFAPLLGLAGLLCLPVLRVREEDRPVAVILLVGLIWAALSSMWSPYKPEDVEGSVALKLALQLPLYWAAWCGARRAAPDLRRKALLIFGWGLAAVGVLMLIEGLTGGGVYLAIRDLAHDPIRPDLGRKNLAQGTFVMALLWPVATVGAMRSGATGWMVFPMIVGSGFMAFMFLSDAPVLAIGIAIFAGLAAWIWPRIAAETVGLFAAAFYLLMPAVMLGGRSLGRGYGIDAPFPDSWSQRLGYWSHAVDAIDAHPLKGWGLDASRMFSPGIQLHPHNGALQIWLELGVVGAIAAALFWALILRNLARERSDLTAAALTASATIYLLFGALNFGIWQEWWLALGALICVFGGLMSAPLPSKVRRSAAKSST